MTYGAPVQSFAGTENLRNLLDRHGIPTSGWGEVAQRGFSGARIHRRARSDGASYVVKTTSADTDWIMRATSDDECREAALAEAFRLRDDRVSSPAIGSARDGDVFSILMHDVSDHLLTGDGVDHDQLDTIWRGMAGLHSLTPPDDRRVRWCSVRDRLTLFVPDPDKLRRFRIAHDILHGWELFFEHAPRGVATLVRSLFDDLAPLEHALQELPRSFLHGDLKLDNIAILPTGSLCLIDWSMPLIAPAAVDLGWFLAMNSTALPTALATALSAYTRHSTMDPRWHDRHESLTVLCGLLLRGWRKALDARAGRPAELHWWCDRASNAAALL